MVGAQTGGIKDRFDDSGQSQSIAAGLNRSLVLSDYAAMDPRLKKLDGALRSVDPALADQLLATNLATDFELRVRTVMPAYEYGVRDWLNVGVRVPVVTREGRARFLAQTVNNAAAARARIGGLSPELGEGLRDLGAQRFDTAYFQGKLFAEKGYDAPSDFSKTELGDVEFGGKFRLVKQDSWISSLQIGARAPTGSRPSRTNIFDRGSGNGAWAAGVQLFNDVYPKSWLTLGSNVRGGYYFPDRFETAVPKDPSDLLPSSRDQDGQWRTVSRRQGFEFLGEISATARFDRRRWQAWGAYQVLNKGADSFSGDGKLYYDGLSQGTAVDTRSLEAGIGYSSIPDFLERRTKVPFEINALYNWMIAGRNSPVISYGRVDLIGYF